ncbi:hypothetical protein GGQ92_002022 [Gracilibacillus halotolerans]|uniref:Tat pathway signal sequence domain protein n=1 Tax=Gracilibacillus halotolerans TaxID=74386 RepID=A0A841RRK0_9BACI|nr:hypothetical protein [Gracilibacillus halotolerans]MBB6513218.1 hypothetical protein [Gracilibacillus halotolerans]
MVKLNWLYRPHVPTVVTWGVPWPKGKLKKDEPLSLWNGDEELELHEVRPTAYWPDGTIKWTAHSALLAGEANLAIKRKSVSTLSSQRIQVEETPSSLVIHTGNMNYRILREGNILIDEIRKDNRIVASNLSLETLLEQREESGDKKVRVESTYRGVIDDVIIETSGQIRSVTKVTGHHINNENHRVLPFILRLEFRLNTNSIKVIHTQMIDINPSKYFIKGMALKVNSASTGEPPWNRYVQIGTETGVYSEAAQLLLTRSFQHANGLYAKQIENIEVDLDEFEQLKEHVTANAIWNDYKIVHDSANHYKMLKRTSANHAWIEIAHGERASGAMCVGSKNGAIAISHPKMREKHPAGLEVNQLAGEPVLTIWLWSPDSEAMDLRHYSNETYVKSAYEGFDEMRATPIGIANTNELFISFYSKIPKKEEFQDYIDNWRNNPLLICEPSYYYETKAVGAYSLPNESSPFHRFLEVELDNAFTFYKREVEQRSWYGFWNYGDVMHTYDPIRHQWRYDLGGFAWQNTELAPNIWLWYMFFRTGRNDIFDFAEAMTRHTSEVDCYHFGEYKGLGSRHNVSHWGCGCKEVRVSMAGLYRYYYYLTADERTGELLKEVKDADYATRDLDPMREYFPKDQYPTHVRSGPDWAAFTSNWLVEWERTENTKYLDKITSGMNTLKKLPLRLLSGPTFGYDPETSQLTHMGDGTGGYHMMIAFGAPQVWMEIAELLEDEEWKDMLAEYGEFYVLSDQEKRNKTNNVLNDQHFHWPMFAAAMTAYAAKHKNNLELAEKAWTLLLDEKYSHTPLPIVVEEVNDWKRIEEIPWITTNTISQWCINVIVCLELLQDMPPNKDAFPQLFNMQESVKMQKGAK